MEQQLRPQQAMVVLCFLLLATYSMLLHRRASAARPSADLKGIELILSAEHDDQIEQMKRVNAGLKRSQELLGDSAMLASEVQRLAAGLTRAVETEISQAAVNSRAAEARQRSSVGAAVPVNAQQQQGPAGNQAHSNPNPHPQAQQPQPQPQPAMPQGVHQWLRDCKETTQRAQHVVNAMQHSWDSYVKFAWGHDELQPLSKRGKSSFGSLGATIIDSLDTLHIMGLNSRFEQAKSFVLDLKFDKNFDASVFETTIRVVGGMLSAHDLTGEAVFLHKTQELVDRLLHAFDTPSGIPYNQLNLHTLQGKNPGWTQKMSTLAEFGTEQMEFYMLSAKTGKDIYRRKAEHSIKLLHDRHPDKGLIPIYLNPATGDFSTQQVSFGAMGDSYYEYLLKVWVLFGKNDEMYRQMWEKSMDEMMERLIHKTTPSGFTYVCELSRSGGLVHKMDHLACFVPGMLALGVHHKAVSGPKADRYMEVARELTETCHLMYKRMPGGLAPEYIEAKGGQDFTANARAAYNLQRPEAVEAFFVMYRVTGDTKYQEYGWNVFAAFETFTRVGEGYTGIKDVTKVPMVRDDTMQSFWLAETLKYLYLLFSPTDKISLDKWVLNTEAHPMKIRPWKFEPHKPEDVRARNLLAEAGFRRAGRRARFQPEM